MRWYWAIVGAAVAVVIVLASVGFFSKFTPQDWTTFVIAAVALLGTLFTIFRGLVGKPHWQRVRLEPRVTSTSSAGPNSPTSTHSALTFYALNGGPGVAERVEYEFKCPGQDWVQQPRPLQPSTFDRHDWIRFSLIGWNDTADKVPPGHYKVRLWWSALPDTSRRPRKTFSFKITARSGPTPET